MVLREKIDALKTKEKERLQKKLEAIEGDYRDTGKDCYYRTMQRLQAEIDAIDGMDGVTVAEVENLKVNHRKHLKDIKNRAEEFMMDEPLNIEFKHFCKWLNNYIEVMERELY